MVFYRIANNARERADITYPWVFWDDWFTADELKKISEYCESLELEKGTTLAGVDESIRVSQVRMVHWNQEASWFFDKLNNLIHIMNDRWYNMDLNGYEFFQYTTYGEEEQGRYDWHMDMHLADSRDQYQPRKFSLSLMLNDDYEGGELQFNVDGEYAPQVAQKKVGRVIAFPSYIFHRVTPVVKGTRKSIVVWVVGPKFV